MFCHHSKALFSSREQSACPAKPDDSSWTSTTGLTSEADCNTKAWRCDAGYDNQENSSQCHHSKALFCQCPSLSSKAIHHGQARQGLPRRRIVMRGRGGVMRAMTTGRPAAVFCHHSKALFSRWEQTVPDDSSWTSTTGLTSEADCNARAWRCDAGYDNQETSSQCSATIAKHYSPVGSNARTACPAKPDDSSWTSTTGLTSEVDCNTKAWRCNAGYDNQENSSQCSATIAKHYSSVGSNDRVACPGKLDDSSWASTTGLTSEVDCNTKAWRCNAGYDNQENSSQCSATIAKHYSPVGSNARTACPAKPDDSSWTSTTGLTSEADCNAKAWRCDAGYDNRETSSQCSATIAGHYSPVGSNARIACPAKPDDSSWTSTTGLTSEADCNTKAWRCNAGYDNQENSSQCSATIAGHYSPAGSNSRRRCPARAKPSNALWMNTGLALQTDCVTAWRCDAGYDNQENSSQCSATIAKHYSPAGSNDRFSCGTVIAPNYATADSASTGLRSANECWTCNAGYDDHNDTGFCSETVAGYYSPEGSSERIACAKPVHSSWTARKGLTSANDCSTVWTCDAGYDSQEDNSRCQSTIAGHYSPVGSNDRFSCGTVIVPNHATADSTSTGLRFANECWTCNAGYDDHNDTGFCSITDSTYYSPAGSSERISCNTVTVPSGSTKDVVSTGLKSFRECTICNFAGYMLTGNTCMRESIAIAAGDSHTCAILSGGAVRCWGSNEYGQTGGGRQ